jgi:hypothetical protein
MGYTLNERRRLAWYLRYGAGWTFVAIGKELSMTKQTVSVDVKIIERKIYRSWLNNKLPSTQPGWWHRLRAAGALRRDEPCGFALLPVMIPPREAREGVES